MSTLMKELLAQASLEELDMDITADQTVIADEIAPEEIEDSDQAVAELLEDHKEITEVVEDTADLVEVAQSLEAFAIDFESSVGRGGLSQTEARIASRTVDRLYKKVGIVNGKSPVVAVESFGGDDTRLSATTASLEGIKDQLRVFWTAIYNGIKQVWNRITTFATNLFGEIPRLQKRAAALSKVAGSVKGSAAGKWNPPGARAIHVGGSAKGSDVIKGLNELEKAVAGSFKEVQSVAPDYYGKLKSAANEIKAGKVGEVDVKADLKFTSGEFSGGKKVKPSESGYEIESASAFKEGEYDYPTPAEVKEIAAAAGNVLRELGEKKAALNAVQAQHKALVDSMDSLVKSFKEGGAEEAKKNAAARKIMRLATKNLSGSVSKVSATGVASVRAALAYGERAVKQHGKTPETKALPAADKK